MESRPVRLDHAIYLPVAEEPSLRGVMNWSERLHAAKVWVQRTPSCMISNRRHRPKNVPEELFVMEGMLLPREDGI